MPIGTNIAEDDSNPTPKKRIHLSNNDKLTILKEAYSKEDNIRATARLYGVCESSIRGWKIKENLLSSKKSN